MDATRTSISRWLVAARPCRDRKAQQQALLEVSDLCLRCQQEIDALDAELAATPEHSTQARSVPLRTAIAHRAIPQGGTGGDCCSAAEARGRPVARVFSPDRGQPWRHALPNSDLLPCYRRERLQAKREAVKRSLAEGERTRRRLHGEIRQLEQSLALVEEQLGALSTSDERRARQRCWIHARVCACMPCL